MKLKRTAFRHIEAEIYAYHETLKEIEELRWDIILAGSCEDSLGQASGRGYSTTSTVERRATKLADSILLREMERITGAIAETYARAKEDIRRVVWVKYGLALLWKPPQQLVEALREQNRFNLRPEEMAAWLAIDESTFHRYRTGFVHGVAERLGWY